MKVLQHRSENRAGCMPCAPHSGPQRVRQKWTEPKRGVVGVATSTDQSTARAWPGDSCTATEQLQTLYDQYGALYIKTIQVQTRKSGRAMKVKG